MGLINDGVLDAIDRFACMTSGMTALLSIKNPNDFFPLIATMIPPMYRLNGDLRGHAVARLPVLLFNLDSVFNNAIPIFSSSNNTSAPLAITCIITAWNCGRDLYDLYRGHLHFPWNEPIPQEEIEVEVPITSSELFIINLGAALIIDEVLAGASGKTEKKFIAMDPDILNFVISKAVFLSSIKNSRNPVPKCFALETREQILALRRELRDQNLIKEALIELFESPQTFKMGINDTAVLPFFNRIRAHSISELSNPAFLSCIQRAVNLLQERRMQASLRALSAPA